MNSNIENKNTRSDPSVLFLHSMIDDSGLTSHHIRILLHIARRAGPCSMNRGSAGECYAGLRQMTYVCGMAINTIRKVLGDLVEMNVIERSRPRGRAYADHYRLKPMNEWSWLMDADGRERLILYGEE